MEDLAKMRLVGDGLIHIDRPETIRRYRECMERLGLEPTKLDEFHIDGIGWSPEIADEMGNRWYLTQDIANPLGIIVTINQKDCPVYTPTHSFDRFMMMRYYRDNGAAIADLTTQTGIALEIDQRMSWYNTIEQVESVQSVSIISHGGDLQEHAKRQVILVSQFLNEETDDWMDVRLRDRLRSELKENGALYERDLLIPQFDFVEFDDYHTAALGGVYVFRDLGKKILTVVEDKKQALPKGADTPDHVMVLGDNDLIDRVQALGIANIDTGWYQRHPYVLEERLRTLGYLLIGTQFPKTDLSKLTTPQTKSRLMKCSDKRKRLYEEFELCVSRILSGERIDKFSPEVKALLLHPIRTNSRYEENLVWRLICQIQPYPVDIMRLYAVDKNLFVEKYQSWGKPLRAIARSMIEQYDSHHTYSERK